MRISILILAITFFIPQGLSAQPFIPESEAKEWAERILSDLTLEKKIAQMICTDIAGDYITASDPALERWTQLAGDIGVGGFVVYGGTPRDVAHLLNHLQKTADLPILMSVDFEGGPGQQVAGATEFPANMAFAAAGSESLMFKAASAAAVEGRAMGFHLTYTPVVDVSVSPDNPAESVRSCGGDLELWGKLFNACVRGYTYYGMLTTAKHFPGRGDADLDEAFPGFRIIDKTADRVAAEEFRAFKYAVNAGVAFVMSEHIAVPSVSEGSDLPASVEGKLATGWLRGKLGFSGILTTDDLWYDHVVDRFGPVEVAVRSFQAGHDIILKPKDPVAVIEGLVEAVRSGRIAESRIDRSVKKLLIQKARLNLHNHRLVDENHVNALVGTRAHLEIAQEVADRSLTLIKNDGVLPLQTGSLENAVHLCIQKLYDDPSPPLCTAKLASAFPGLKTFYLRPGRDPSGDNAVRSAAASADLVILSLFIQRDRHGDPAPFRDEDLKILKAIIAEKPGSVIAMSYGNPYLLQKIGDVSAFCVGYGERGWYGNQEIYFSSFIRLLRGDLSPEGKLPVRLNDDYPIGTGLTF